MRWWMTLMTAACDQPPTEPMMQTSHPLGFVLQHPVSATVQSEPDRLVVRPAGWRRQRSPYELVVQRSPSLPETGYTTRQLDERTVHHRERIEEAGSSGPLHELEGAISLDGAVYTVRFLEQSSARTAPHAWIYWEALRSLRAVP